MSLPRRRKIRTLALLFCVVTFTTFLFSYTLRDPSLYFFKYAFRLSDSFFFSSGGPCACRRRCMTEAEDDPWFAERFNRSVRPLMTRENSVLSDDTFKWWQETLLTGSPMRRVSHTAAVARGHMVVAALHARRGHDLRVEPGSSSSDGMSKLERYAANNS
ncbi:CMP-N-acetylneuraminate-beta-galactosamide-alpha-2,3-sialyltransferase 1 [Liparis tanakae]|uniref:CMP-N-acetylneuraminate-beta-galactosamide-alpha-2,3-sialyltransferase 1 n=1 Tax=Liparis tanakae TaxID=230148 RepID=A0A4Z2FJD0_9TELE|nr:CMP-N-acetylneuraminate-beta-galactosamide-alpha-2,3-sialyltransferase 1 [Liparis tanakae]